MMRSIERRQEFHGQRPRWESAVVRWTRQLTHLIWIRRVFCRDVLAPLEWTTYSLFVHRRWKLGFPLFSVCGFRSDYQYYWQ